MLHVAVPKLHIGALLWLPAIYLAYFFVHGIYRITLHPLAKFPGPKLAAFTRWYEIYFEISNGGGRFSEHIELLHKRYGPIVRVNPHDLHIDDPAFYDQLYNLSPDIDRNTTAFDNLQNSPSFELHKIRRKAFEPYFSKPSVLKLEGVVASSVKEVCQWLDKARRTGEPVDMGILARSLTSDIITEYIFAKPYGFLQDPARSEAFFAAGNTIFQSLFLNRESIIVNKILEVLSMIPPSWLPRGHVAHSLVPFMQSVEERISRAQQRRLKGELQGAGHRVLFDDYDILALPAGDKKTKVQMDNAILFVTAGFETTGFTIETALFHVLSNPPILAKLKQELSSVMDVSGKTDTLPSWPSLEKLPYLTAVIYESLRMSLGVASRLPRKNTRSAMVYKEWVIPKGQFVSLSQRDILYNPQIYPDPTCFNPDRWLKGEESRELVNKWLVSFSKGARRCIGMHLAYAELYLTLAAIFGQFELELYQTTRREVEPKVDYFIPKAEHGTKGVRVVVK